MALDVSKIVGLKVNAETLVGQCPICFFEGGHDKQKNHLVIFKKTLKFCCAKYKSDKDHNRKIYKALSGEGLDSSDIVIIDPEPKLICEKIYPENMLDKLVPDHSYWINRGIKEEVLKKMGGGKAPEEEKSKLSNRYIFPIRNVNGKLTGFAGRLVESDSFGPKWKNLVKTSQAIYPWYQMSGKDIEETKTVVILESIGDCISLCSYDICNSIILFGLNINSKIISKLVSVGVKNVIISTNNDKFTNKHTVGNEAAIKLKNKLDNFFNSDNVIIRLPESAKDWGEATEQDIIKFKSEIDNKIKFSP